MRITKKQYTIYMAVGAVIAAAMFGLILVSGAVVANIFRGALVDSILG